MIRVGIPRALLYYQYYPMWLTFFRELGAEVVLSPITNREIVETGIAPMVAETCFPVKVYVGHTCWLRDQGVDTVFIPAIRSVDVGAYNCGKFLGLPDLVRATVRDCPPLLEIDIDINQGQRAFYQAIYGLGMRFTWNPLKVKRASEQAWQAHLDYQATMRQGLTPIEALGEMGIDTTEPGTGEEERGQEAAPDHQPTALKIAVIGHPYCVYDAYINYNIVRRLRSMGIQVVTGEMAPAEGIEEGITRLAGQKYWTYEGEVVGAAGFYFDDRSVDGIISIAAFACGPDSVMLDVVQGAARREKRPYMSLIIDEHTGEAGMVTRLEAFVDMLARQTRGDG
ncbi:MAG: acyl-CoA dehydratase activase-related protein [Anaerolineae bacterium]